MAQNPLTSGVASLLVTLLLGGIIVEMSLIGMLLITKTQSANSGIRQSQDTLAGAQSGLDDGILSIIRNKNGPYSDKNFSIGVAAVEVSFCKNAYSKNSDCDTAVAGVYEVTSIASASLKRRKMVAQLRVNATTGLVVVESIKEVVF